MTDWDSNAINAIGSPWERANEYDDVCVCGHALEDHIEGFDPCSLCECQQFKGRGHD